MPDGEAGLVGLPSPRRRRPAVPVAWSAPRHRPARGSPCSRRTRTATTRSHRMLLGNADIENAARMRQRKLVEPGAGGHGGGDRDDLVVKAGFPASALGEDGGVGLRIRLGLRLREAGDDVEGVDAVILVGGVSAAWIALALLGHDMDQDRAGRIVADIAQPHRHTPPGGSRPAVIQRHVLDHERQRRAFGDEPGRDGGALRRETPGCPRSMTRALAREAS